MAAGDWNVIDAGDVQHGDVIRVTGTWNGPSGLSLKADGYVLSDGDVVERKEPEAELPTDGGFYEDIDGDLWFLDNVGYWYLSTNGEAFDEDSSADQYLPFTKLKLTQE